MEKLCRKCGETKPFTEFYRHAYNRDRLQAYCKPCCLAHLKPLTRKHRQLTDEIRIKRNLAKQRNRKKYPEKRQAQQKIDQAVKAGKVVRKPCERCGTTVRVHAHHDDYSRPFAVRWLCHQHHIDVHKELN